LRDARRGEERLVVAHDQQGTVISAQARFDGFDGRRIKVIGWFVENEQRWRVLASKHAGEAGARSICPPLRVDTI
jgi:hypothetical protein